jgi:hypothetical protein
MVLPSARIRPPPLPRGIIRRQLFRRTVSWNVLSHTSLLLRPHGFEVHAGILKSLADQHACHPAVLPERFSGQRIASLVPSFQVEPVCRAWPFSRGPTARLPFPARVACRSSRCQCAGKRVHTRAEKCRATLVLSVAELVSTCDYRSVFRISSCDTRPGSSSARVAWR